MTVQTLSPSLVYRHTSPDNFRFHSKPKHCVNKQEIFIARQHNLEGILLLLLTPEATTMDERSIDNAWDDMVDQAIAFAALSNSNLLLQIQSGLQDSDDDDDKGDHRQLPRAQRRQFKHGEALSCINRNYLGPDPLFGKEFDLMFRISRQRFQKLLEDVGNSGANFTLRDERCFEQGSGFYGSQIVASLENSCLWCCTSLFL
jgi:hypothetical protein